MSYWIQTSTGGFFQYNDAHSNEVSVVDIANHTSKICRFSGATKDFYSVAQHQMLVEEILREKFKVTPKTRMVGLLHDGHEAYMNDSPTPFSDYVSHLVGHDIIEQIKQSMDVPIFTQLVGELPSKSVLRIVKDADKIAFITEASQLLDHVPAFLESFPYEPYQTKIVPLDWREARDQFLETYHILKADMAYEGLHCESAHH